MNQNLESLKARVSRLSVMIFDIDGTLTDGRIFWVPNSGWTQMYSVRDGMGIKRLQEVRGMRWHTESDNLVLYIVLVELRRSVAAIAI